MAVTKKMFIDDIILRVTKGAPSDDLELEPSQIAYWIDMVAKTAIPQELNKAINNKEAIQSVYIEIEDNKVATVENVTMLSDNDDRCYITVSKPILNLVNDYGIVRIITEEGKHLDHVPIEYLDIINNLTFSRPNKNNLLYSRVGEKLYIHGLNPKHVAIVKFSVYYIAAIDIFSMADNDVLKISDALLAIIGESVETMAMKQIGSVDPDVQNDAEDDNNRLQR